jgi:hypothetical protein
MQLITHQHHIDKLPASPIKTHIQARYDQLSEDTDVPPNIVLVEADDDITGPDFAFVGNRGLLSDLWEKNDPGHPEFSRPYEWASYISELQLYEVLLLINNEDGYLILILEAIVDSHPELHWILTAKEQGRLSDPQPLQ